MIAISVILPTYNRLDRLKRVLAALERQDCPRDDFEVVIVSDGSTDGTNEHLKSMRVPFRTRITALPSPATRAWPRPAAGWRCSWTTMWCPPRI